MLAGEHFGDDVLFDGILKKKGNTFPFNWSYRAFRLNGGLLSWYKENANWG